MSIHKLMYLRRPSKRMLRKYLDYSTKSNIIVFGGANNMIFTINQLKEKYCDYANPLDKIKRDCDNGVLFRIARGLYEDNPLVNPIFLAASLLAPSYISFDYALSYYGLIPERVETITSASLLVHKNKTFHNYFGDFSFSDIPADAFAEGTTYIFDGEYGARIATKEKALCDSLYKWPVVHSVKDLKQLLFEDKRIDEEEFMTCDFKSLVYIASLYHKTNLELLIKLIRKEYYRE